MPEEASRKTYFGIQALRAVAAFLVVAQHTVSSWNTKIGQATSSKLHWDNGSNGVDVFFVISGFVMMVTAPGLMGFRHKGRVFFWRRLVRIVPLYWIFTVVKILWLKYGFPSGYQPIGSAWRVIASFLFIPTYDFDGRAIPILGVGWTLNFEMLFYLLFTLALALEIAPLTLLLPTLLILANVGWFLPPDSPAITGFCSPLLLEFLFGVALARFTLRGRLPGPVSGWLLLVGGLVTLVFIPIPQNPYQAYFWGPVALAVVTGAVALESSVGERLPRWLLEAGNASYAVYLAHLFVVSFVVAVAVKLGARGMGGLALSIAVSLFVNFVVGVGVHRLIELPLITILRGKRVRGVSVLPGRVAT